MKTKLFKNIVSNNKFHKKSGNALILVVILFLVISILSLAMLAVANGEFNQVIAEEKIDQARYTARAVVQATADWMVANHEARDEMAKVIPPRTTLGEGYAKTSSSSLDGKSYLLKVWRNLSNASLIHIKATSTVQSLSASASLTLKEYDSGYALFEDAIYSFGPFGKSTGSSNNVYGSVATAEVDQIVDGKLIPAIPDNLNVYGEEKTGRTYDFEDILPAPELVFPAKIETASLSSGNINDDPTNLNAYYGSLTLSNTVYIKNTNAAGDPQDVHIWIENLIVTDKTELWPTDINGGRIFIYNTDTIFCDKKFGIAGNDAQPCVFLICSGTGIINIDGNPFMDVYIYGPHINIEYGGAAIFNGAIISNIYGWNGGVDVFYAKPDLTNSPFSNLDKKLQNITISEILWNND